MDDLDELGPLPESDDNSILQAESFKALEHALPAEQFVLRQEPQPDAGVDWSVELRIGGRYTGMRAHIQVKARAETKANSDGSISYSADVSNINYLLNGSSPLYVVYLADGRELRYAWVRDEVNRIQKENADWKQQKTVTLRFTSVLDEVGLQDVHDRIRREARLDRQIHDVLSRAEVTEQTIHVNLKDSKVTDPAELRDLLLRGGLTLVSSGEAARVLEVIERLSYGDRRLPRILMVSAFAELSLGRHQLAAGYVSETFRHGKELSESDRQFLGVLRDVCDHKLGRITTQEYIRRQLELAERTDGEFGLSRRIDCLRLALLDDATQKGIANHLPKLRMAVQKALAIPDASESFRLQAKIALAQGDGARLVQRYIEDIGILESRLLMGLSSDAEKILEAFNLDLAGWVDAANKLVEDAQKLGNAHLFADICVVRASTLFVKYCYAFMKMNQTASKTHLRVIRDQIIPDVRQAVRLYKSCGSLEWELRTKLLLADLCDLVGDRNAAVCVANEVLPEAEAYQYDKIEKEARDHISGDPFFRQMQRKHLFLVKQDPDLWHARETDERMHQFAEDMLKAMGLPQDRFRFVFNDALAERDISKEKVYWCRHIELIPDSTHHKHPLTRYSFDPERHCYCEKFKLRSKIGSTDWKVLIRTFKNNYCMGCTARSPKHETTTGVGGS